LNTPINKFATAKRAVRRFTKSRFVRNVVIVATGTAGAQAIALATAPIVTRLYGPNAFGLLGTFSAILAILTPLSALSYPIAIVLPKCNAEAMGLMKLSLYIAIATSSLLALLLLFFGQSAIEILSLQPIKPFVWFFPIAIFFSATLSILAQWMIREGLFILTSKVKIVQAIFLNGGKALLGLIAPTGGVLILLTTIGNGIYTLMLWASLAITRKQYWPSRMDSQSTKHKTLRSLAWHYRDFAYYRTPQIVLNAASQGTPVLILAGYFGAAAAGFYTLARTALSMPSSLIGNAIGDVFYPRVSRAANQKDNISTLLWKSTALLLGAGMLPFGVIFFFGPSLFVVIFGDEWATAGHYARWLSIWLLFMLANQPSVKSLPVIRAQGFHLVFTCLTITLRITTLIVGYSVFDDDVHSIAAFSIVSAILNILLIIITINRCRKFDRGNAAVEKHGIH